MNRKLWNNDGKLVKVFHFRNRITIYVGGLKSYKNYYLLETILVKKIRLICHNNSLVTSNFIRDIVFD